MDALQFFWLRYPQTHATDRPERRLKRQIVLPVALVPRGSCAELVRQEAGTRPA